MKKLDRYIVWGMCSLALAAFWGCATPAVVLVSPDYNAQHVQRVALLDFDDFPGQQGSGSLVADVFEKYLITTNYQLMERSDVDKVLAEQHFDVSGAVDPATVAAMGKLLGVQGLVMGSISEFTDTSEQTVMVDIPQEETDPMYGQVTTRQRTGGQTVVTQQTVVTGYSTSVTDQVEPETETMPARVGLSARLVSVKTGTVLWSGSSSADGMDISSAAEYAAQKLIQALQSDLKKLQTPPPT